MQQLCMNKFVSPTTGATISSAQFGILLALLFMPNSTLWGRALFGALFVLVCDMLGRVVIAPYELPSELIVGILGSLLFVGLLFYRLKHGRRAIRLKGPTFGCGAGVSDLEGGADEC